MISRENAKVQGHARFFTGELCSNGHIAERYVSGAQCVECMKGYDRKATAARREESGGKPTFSTGKPCKFGHVAERFVSGRACVECAAQAGKRGYDARMEKAKAEGKTRFFTGEPCPQGHIADRLISSYACVECHKAATKVWRKTTPGGQALVKRQRKAWHATPAGKVLKKRGTAKHFLTPSGQVTIRRNKLKYYARQMAACPPWVDLDALTAFFRACPEGHHTDHIVPLKGKTADGHRISGLHVIWNLQYLPRLENIAKHNIMRRHEQDLCERIS